MNRNGNVRTVTRVDSIYRGLDQGKSKPIGQHFFRDQDFQWSRDSNALYLIRDQFYDSKGSQLYSKYGELWKYDLETGKLQIVLKSFGAYQFFFGEKGIYFSVPTPQGDLQLIYSDGQKTINVGNPNQQLFEETLNQGNPDQVFYSFDTVLDHNSPNNGPYISTKVDEAKGIQTWSAGEKPFLSVSKGDSIKGTYYCGSVRKTRYLPGDNYALIDLSYCGDFNGQLLVNLRNGEYASTPKDTRIYLPLNTDNHRSFSISGGGITFR